MEKFVILFFVVTASFPAVAQPYVGRWAPNQKICRDEGADSRIEFRKNLFLEHESFCKIGSLKSNLTGNWSAIASCEGEGEQWSLRLDFSAVGSRLLLSKDGGTAERLIRCTR